MLDEPGSRAFETLLEEYKVQRTSAGNKLATSQHTMTFGGATTGILIAAGFNIWRQPVPATLIFLVAVPLVCAFVVVQWVGQMRSFGRTHEYINALEKAMLAELRAAGRVPDALFAKHTRKSAKWYYPDERWFQSAAIVVFGLIAAGSLAVGVYKGFADHKALVIAVGLGEFALLSAVAVVLLWALRFQPADRLESAPVAERLNSRDQSFGDR